MRTKYFTRPNGDSVCLWRVSPRNRRVRVYGKISLDWSTSICKAHHLIQPNANIIQVTRDQARKWFPKAFTKPFNA